ncbi:MAG: IclR family transcriptional regulator [Lautropia sp.]|nr:IclR family transcriptional regulator [Lautropia sp.]
MSDAGMRDSEPDEEDAAKLSGEEPQLASSSQRSLAVLEFVSQADPAPTLMDIADALALPKATVFRLCTQLVAQRWLSKTEERAYRPGSRLHALCFNLNQEDRFKMLRHQILTRLVERIGETCNLTMLDGNEVLYLDRVETHWPLRMVLDAGSHVPIHATASGKLFLAFMSAPARRALLEAVDLCPLTPHTLTSIEALDAESRQIRELGYACDREEFLAGLIALAVPVHTEGQACRAAIAVHAPSARMSLDKAKEALPLLQDAAMSMQGLLR